MAVGQTIKLTAVANPSNAENTNIKFVESPTLPRRLTVTADGTVTANYLGKAWLYIQSEDGNVSETYWIDVVNLPTSVKLSDTKVTLYPGETRQLNASIAPQDAEDTSCRWESSNPSVATVNADGLVTPVSYGTAVIKASCNDGGAYGQCEVTVAKRPNNFTLSGPDTIVVGETATYKLEALPSDTVIRETSWQVDNESVVKIEQIDLTTVKITGIVGGKSQLQVFANDRAISLDINVVRYPDSVDIAEEEIFMTVGQQEQLSAKVSPEDTTDKTTTWTSDNNMVASVSADGKITAHKIGEATISCTTADGKKSDHVLVRVQIPAFALEVDETDITLYVNRSCKINATVQPENATYKNVVLKPSNNLLKVDQETMTLHGLQPGTCVLWVSTPDGSLAKPIFVTILESANNPITSIAITSRPNKVIYHDGENFDKSGMSVTAYYSDGFSEEVTDYILSGYNSTPGTKVITVTYHEFTTTFTVDVLARCGDVNSDSKTNSSDALLILQYSVGKITEIDATYADANHDGRINSSDALIALQISVGNYNGDLWFNIEDDFATTHQIKS